MMRQHCEIKRKHVLMSVNKCKPKPSQTHTNTLRVTDGLLAIEERTQDQTPAQNDPLASKHVNLDTHTLKLRETYTD